ncbi:MAG: ATP-binding protein [Acidobacteriota bacterium]
MKLLVTEGPLRRTVFELTKSVVVIGRKRDADISLARDSLVSRFHCQLSEHDGVWWVEDLGSGNGTYLEGDRLEAPAKLLPGGELRLGETSLRLLSEEDAEDSGRLDQLAGGEASTVDQPKPVLPVEEKFDGDATHRPPVGARPKPSLKLQSTGSVKLSNDPTTTVIEIAGAFDPSQSAKLPAGEDRNTINLLRQRLEVTQNVATAVAGKPDLKTLMEAVLEGVMGVIPAERGFVVGVSEDQTQLDTIVARRADGRPPEDITISRTMVAKTLEEKVGLLVHDALGDARLVGAHSIMGGGIRAALCVPFIDQDRVAAILHVDASTAESFTNTDLELAGSVVNQASLAITNARLFDELKEAYEALQSAQAQLVESEKLSIIGTLAASIAHDVGNVLTPISGIAKIVMRDDSINPKLKEAFDRQMGRLKALTHQLLSFSKPKPPDLVPVDINKQLEDSLGLVKTEARHHGSEIVFEPGEGGLQVLADADRLDQVFINIALNAVHAMQDDDGGTLTVSTRSDGDAVVVDLADTGCGIPAEKLASIFEPFFTTKGKAGTGMGLFSCRRIVEEEHGGSLAVESELGKGTTFHVRIPSI